MTATTWGTGGNFTRPTNQIVVSGTPHVQFAKIHTAANMYAGRLVAKDTTDGEIGVNGAVLTAIGWLGYEQTEKKYRPATVATIYTVNSMAAVLTGNFVLLASVPVSQTIVKGTALKATTAGQVIPAGATDDVVAIAEESCASGDSVCTVMVRSLI